MHSLGMLLKSYRPDLGHASRLLASFERHNVASIPLYVVVPAVDVEAFTAVAGVNVTVLSEDVLAEHLVKEPVAGIRPGYINQEIVKLAFWELGLTQNYFCVDSDAVFVRDFGPDDFMFDTTTPYTVLVEDNELKVEPRYFEQHWKGREIHLRRIQELVGLDDRRILTCHGHQVLSSAVLASLRREFMDPREWDYRHLLAESPYEFSWYNFWLQKSGAIPIAVREPLVKTLHNEDQQLEYALRGVTTEDVARGYLALVVNSNFSRDWGTTGGVEAPEEVLARYVPYAVLSKALALKARDTASRRLRG